MTTGVLLNNLIEDVISGQESEFRLDKVQKLDNRTACGSVNEAVGQESMVSFGTVFSTRVGDTPEEGVSHQPLPFKVVPIVSLFPPFLIVGHQKLFFFLSFFSGRHMGLTAFCFCKKIVLKRG